MLKGIKAIIFDFDGTVADTIPAIREAINASCAEIGKEPLSYEEVIAGINRGSRHLVKACLADTDRLDDEKYVDGLFDIYSKNYRKCYTNTKEPYAHIREALEALKSRGYRLAVLSNKPDIFLHTLTESVFGSELFEAIQGATKELAKPDSRLTFELLRQLDPDILPTECAVVGDSDIDILTAKEAGMTPVSVAWGYRSVEFLREHGAEIVINDPLELITLFE